jgi:soluble lytic murein transglycosylase-like protein
VIPSGIPAELAGDPDRLALLPVFDRWAAEYGVPPDLLKALAWFESGWNNELVSSAGAIGIGQVLPITGDFVSEVLIGAPIDLDVPEENVRAATRYLRYLLDEAGDVRLAIASYYQGLRATRAHGIYASSEFYVDGIMALRDRFD